MPFNIQPINFKVTGQDLGSVDLGDALRKGFGTYQGFHESKNTPARLSEDLLGKHLSNSLSKIKEQYAPQMEEATLKEKLANASRASQLANQPFGGMLSGIGKEAYGIAQLTGQDPSEVAKKLYENKLQQAMTLNEYRQGLTQGAPTRGLSSFGKIGKEEEDVAAGFEPGSNRTRPINPEKQQELLGQYSLLRQKTATDADTRKKNLLASNIEKTIETINPKDLTHFAGIKGSLEFRKDQANAASNPGSESKAYREYLKAANNAQFLAHQVRQFYGDSIQPAMLKKLELLTNPGTWKNNPTIAADLYKSFTDLLGKETGTYREALKNTKEYEEPKQNSSINEPSEKEINEEAQYFGTTPEIIKSGLAAGVKTEDEFRDWIKGLQ